MSEDEFPKPNRKPPSPTSTADKKAKEKADKAKAEKKKKADEKKKKDAAAKAPAPKPPEQPKPKPAPKEKAEDEKPAARPEATNSASEAAIFVAERLLQWMETTELGENRDEQILALGEKLQGELAIFGTATEVLTCRLGTNTCPTRLCNDEDLLPFANMLLMHDRVSDARELRSPDVEAKLKHQTKTLATKLIRYLQTWRPAPSAS